MKPYSSQLVESLQNWKDLGTNNISRLNKALELYSNAIPVTESEFLQQPKSLLEQMIVAIIATDNISFDKLKKYIYDNVKDEKTKEDLVKISHDEIDLKRVKTNHEIINKRFNLDKLLHDKNSNLYKLLVDSLIPQLGMIEVCKLLDTYSLSIQDKFALMVEELGYIGKCYNRGNDYLYSIIPVVHTFLFCTYLPTSVSEDIIAKVEDSIDSKIDNSVFIQNYIVKSCIDDITTNTKRLAYDKIKDFVKSSFNTGNEECMDDIVNLFSNLACLITKEENAIDISNIAIALYHQFFNVSNYSNDYDKLMKVAYTFIDTVHRLIDNNPNLIPIFEILKSDVCVYLNRLPLVSNSKFMNTNATKVLREIKDILTNHIYYTIHRKEDDYELEDEPYDVNDDPTAIFTDYDNTLLNDIEKSLNIFQSNVLEESTIETFTNKDVLMKADRELLMFIEESYEKHYPLIDKAKLLSSLNEAVKEIRKNKSTPDNVTKITNLKEIINKVKNYHDENQDDMEVTDIETDKKVMSANIIPLKDNNQSDMKTYTIDRIAKYFNEDTLLANNIAKEAIHEMKLSSYVTLGLDRLKKTASTLVDAQKTAWTNIDRFADTIEKFNDEDDRREARIQVVKNSFLPSMSRCIKSIVLAGGLAALVHPFVGLVALVVRFVNSKRAAKEERQAVADELEVELEMIDRKIRDAEESKDYKKERKLRLLKRKLITYLAKVAVNSKTKWNDEIMFKKDIDDAGSELGLRHDD